MWVKPASIALSCFVGVLLHNGTSWAQTTTDTTAAPIPGADRAWPWLAAAALAVGIVAAIGTFVFVRRESEATHLTIRTALGLGRKIDVKEVEATAAAQRLRERQQADLRITGPDLLEISRQAEFAAADTAGAPVVATWLVEPDEAADLAGGETATIRVTARRSNPFTLTASAKDGRSGSKAVSVASPASDATPIPMLGKGWGSIVVAAIVAGLVTGLGFVRVLGGEALAGFYGTLLGYVFHRTSTERASSNNGTSTAGGADQGGAK